MGDTPPPAAPAETPKSDAKDPLVIIAEKLDALAVRVEKLEPKTDTAPPVDEKVSKAERAMRSVLSSLVTDAKKLDSYTLDALSVMYEFEQMRKADSKPLIPPHPNEGSQKTDADPNKDKPGYYARRER
jgi:hypothetical protein